MKKIMLITLFAGLLPCLVFAQENKADSTQSMQLGGKEKKKKKPEKLKEDYQMQTLFGSNKKLAHGGYLGTTVAGTKLNDEDAILVGGRLAWIIDHRFALGLAGSGLTNTINVDDIAEGEQLQLSMGYGGLLLEPIIASRSPIHMSFPVIIGAGGVGFNNASYSYYNSNTQTWERNFNESDAFFIVEPGAEVEINVLKFMRFAVGASYRFVNGVNLEKLDQNKLNGLSVGATFKLGFF